MLDGRGVICVPQTSTGSIVGYAFVLNLGCAETGLLTFDGPHHTTIGRHLAGGQVALAQEAAGTRSRTGRRVRPRAAADRPVGGLREQQWFARLALRWRPVRCAAAETEG